MVIVQEKRMDDQTSGDTKDGVLVVPGVERASERVVHGRKDQMVIRCPREEHSTDGNFIDDSKEKSVSQPNGESVTEEP